MKKIYEMNLKELEEAMIEESKKYGKEYDGGLSEIRWIRFFKLEHEKGIKYCDMIKEYSKAKKENKYFEIAIKVLNNLQKQEIGKKALNNLFIENEYKEEIEEKESSILDFISFLNLLNKSDSATFKILKYRLLVGYEYFEEKSIKNNDFKIYFNKIIKFINDVIENERINAIIEIRIDNYFSRFQITDKKGNIVLHFIYE